MMSPFSCRFRLVASLRRVCPLLAIAVALAPLAGCRKERKVDITSQLKPDRMPTMVTHNVATLISDSGVPKYKIVAPVWYVYDEADTPYWSFPEGLYLQQFDRKLKVIGSVAADSAHYLSRRQIWKLYGNVEMKKDPKDLFLSQRLYWDQKQHRIYSDTFIHIENATHVLEGTGFESNERLTAYRVLKPTGIFPVNSAELSGPRPQAPGAPPGAPAPVPPTPSSAPRPGAAPASAP